VKYLVKDPVEKVALASSNLQRSIDYWNGILGLKICSQNNKKVVLKFPSDQIELELEDIGKSVLLLSS
jgi:catechol-2,3-dioxygenase